MTKARLSLHWHDRRVGPRQTPRRFLDYIVDGGSLYERHGQDFISWFGWLLPEAEERAARRLLGDEPPDVDGRVAVYVCPEDADLLCGAVTVGIVGDSSEVAWTAPAMSWYDHAAEQWTHEPFEDWPELRFDADAYRRAIEGRPKP